ncbi:hypothetical protein AGMMS49991_06580 [Spirochaetia bacterium]|nr:hypothetical protein AGMMS49991_06510 [Spirochaetia bacterium]GHV82100.1 hypothetical protein AGMMS49991_06580 [Spirochaetia bacterium]
MKKREKPFFLLKYHGVNLSLVNHTGNALACALAAQIVLCEAVHSYRFDFYTAAGGSTPVKQVKQYSDYMLTPRLRKAKFGQLIDGLAPGTAYELRIYAYGSFQAISTQYLTVNFTTNP